MALDYVKIFSVKFDANQYIEELQKLKEKIDELRERQKELRKAGETSSREYVEITAKIKELNRTYRTLEKNMLAQTQAEMKHENLIKTINKELHIQAESLDDINARIRTLNLLKRKLNINNADEVKLLRKVNERINELVERKRKLEDSDTKRIMNIGRYKEAIEDALQGEWKIVLFGEEGAKKLKELSGVMELGGKMAKIFGKSLYAIPVLLLIGAFKTFYDVLKRTFGGMSMIRKVVEPVRAVFDALYERLRMVTEGVIGFFRALKNGNWSEAKRQIVETGKAFKGLGKAISEAVEKGNRIADLKDKLDLLHANATAVAARYRLELAKVDAALSKTTQGTAKYNRLLNQKYQLMKASAEYSLNVAEKELALARAQYNGSRESYNKLMEAQAKYQEAQAEIINVQKEWHEAIVESNRAASERLISLAEKELELFRTKNLENADLTTAKTSEELAKRYELWKLYYSKLSDLLKQKHKLGIIDDKDYEIAKADLDNKLKELADEYKQGQKQIAASDEEMKQKRLQIQRQFWQELAQIDQDNQQAQIQNLEMQKQQELAVWKQYAKEGLISQEQYEQMRLAITEKYSKAIAKVKDKENKALAGNDKANRQLLIAGWKLAKTVGQAMFKDNKALSVAIAIIDTLVSAQKAFRNVQESAPQPIATPLAFMTAATVLASGYARVRQIEQVQVGGGSTGMASKTGTPTFNLPTTVSGGGTSSVARPSSQAGRVQADSQATTHTIRVVNVASETMEMAADEIRVENEQTF